MTKEVFALEFGTPVMFLLIDHKQTSLLLEMGFLQLTEYLFQNAPESFFSVLASMHSRTSCATRPLDKLYVN